ncbi:MAG: MGMT family protein [Armatimonadota bacterium]
MATRMSTRKSWREKLEKPGEREVTVLSDEKAQRMGGRRLLIPTPLDVDAAIRQIPAGKVATTRSLAGYLAHRYDADVTCPLCTGIFVRIAAEAAAEDERAGRDGVTPFWRVVGPDGRLNEKLPGGVESQARRLEAEGHALAPAAGKRPPRVADLAGALADLTEV